MMLIPRRNYGLNLFDEFFNDPFFTGSREKAEEPKNLPVMRTDIREKDGNYLLDVELPGYSKEDIRIELKDGYLTIKAERKSDGEETDQKGRVIRSERFMGTCQRTFYVGDHVKKEDVAAAYEDGVLKLNVPKKVEQPKVEESHYIDIQ